MDTYWNESNWLEFLKMFDISHWYICDNVMKYKQTCIYTFLQK